MFEDVDYEVRSEIDPAELLRFYERQGHATTRAPEKLACMVENTLCFVAARRDGELIGLARGVTDGVTGRLAECKLDPAYQGPACVTRKEGRIEHDSGGIARQMAVLVIQALRDKGVEQIEVLAYGTEVDFCTELGFRQVPGVVVMKLPVDAPLPETSPTSTSGVV